MPKRATPLTAVAVKNAKPGIYVDGGGLQLVVKPTGAAAWIYRYTLAGRRRDMGLGPARGPAAIALAEARGRAGKARELIQAGVDPLENGLAPLPWSGGCLGDYGSVLVCSS
jgi:Arm DNA-binding domain